MINNVGPSFFYKSSVILNISNANSFVYYNGQIYLSGGVLFLIVWGPVYNSDCVKFSCEVFFSPINLIILLLFNFCLLIVLYII